MPAVNNVANTSSRLVPGKSVRFEDDFESAIAEAMEYNRRLDCSPREPAGKKGVLKSVSPTSEIEPDSRVSVYSPCISLISLNPFLSSSVSMYVYLSHHSGSWMYVTLHLPSSVPLFEFVTVSFLGCNQERKKRARDINYVLGPVDVTTTKGTVIPQADLVFWATGTPANTNCAKAFDRTRGRYDMSMAHGHGDQTSRA